MSNKIFTMKKLISFVLTFSITLSNPLALAQDRFVEEEDNNDGIAFIIGALIGVGIALLLSKTLKANPPRSDAIPFQFVVVHRLDLPEGIKILESREFNNLKFTLIEWQGSEEELKEVLKGVAIILEKNYTYEVFSEGVVSPTVPEKEEIPTVGVIGVLDTGADKNILRNILLFVKNMRRDNYIPEDHGTAVAYLAHKAGNAKVALYRVCTGNLCDSWSITKALMDILRRDIEVVNMSFGTQSHDKVVELMLKFAFMKGVKVVAPVGNKPSKRLPFPARLEDVISVAGFPCFPEKICTKADVRERYVFDTPVGKVKGTSFSSAFYAGKLLLKLASR